MNLKPILPPAMIVLSLLVCSCCQSTRLVHDTMNAIPTDGLVAYYRFDGDARDLSGQGHHGTVIGAALAADRFGTPNSAYYFNGTSSYINLGNILDDVFSATVAKFSVAGWAKTVVPGSVEDGGGFIIGKSGGGHAGVYEWGINHYSDNNVYANIFFNGHVTRFTQVTSSPVRSGPWFHFAYVFDGSLPPRDRAKLYINATIDLIITNETGSPGTGTLNTAQPLTIGAGFNFPNTANNYYNGYIDDIRIYNRPLALREIRALYTDEQ